MARPRRFLASLVILGLTTAALVVESSPASADIVPGVSGIGQPFTLDDTLYETTVDGSGTALYRFDGTAFSRIAELPGGARSFVSFRGAIYFEASTSNGASRLYSYDGSAASIVDGSPDNSAAVIVYNDELYLTGDIAGGVGWFGTTDGTTFTQFLDAPAGVNTPVLFGGTLYVEGFVGTGASSHPAAFSFDGSGFAQASGPSSMNWGTEYAGKLYFHDGGDAFSDLRSWDGTSYTNVTADTNLEIDTRFAVYEGKLYFGADTGGSSWSLYSWDGVSVARVTTPAINPQAFAVFGGRLYFEGRNADNVWSTYSYAPVLSFDVNSRPRIAGSAAVGQTLRATPNIWPAGTSISYNWYSGDVQSPDTSSTYVIRPSDAGKWIYLEIVGSKFGYSSNSSIPASVGPVVAGRFTAAPHPTITGAARVGGTLTAHAGTWAPGHVTITFQWYRNGVAMRGATGATHRVTPSDRRRAITVVVTGREVGWSSVRIGSTRVVVR